ncbi:MAG: hypothetical protein AAGD32_15035 [Planctomycetota bacterium]
MAHDSEKEPAHLGSVFSGNTVELDTETTEIELVEAEEVLIDRTAFGFDPEPADTIDAEIEEPPAPIDIRPVPMKYAAAAAMMLGVLGMFAGRQMTGTGPATSMAAGTADTSFVDEPMIERTPGKSYMLYAESVTRDGADKLALRLWSLGIETTVERNVPNINGYALVGTRGFDLINGLPNGVRRSMPGVVEAGFNPEPIHWSR